MNPLIKRTTEKILGHEIRPEDMSIAVIIGNAIHEALLAAKHNPNYNLKGGVSVDENTIGNFDMDVVVGQSEQLVCYCQGCGEEEKKIEYCEKCYDGNRKDAEDFLRIKKKIDKEFRDNEIRDWGCGFMVAIIFIIFLIGFIFLIS